MGEQWKNLGRAMASAREAQGLTQVEVAKRLGVTRTPIQAIERGTGFKKVTSTIRSYATLLGWTPDSPDRILRGEQPALVAPPFAREAATTPGLPMVVQDELERDAVVVATEVIQLPDGTSVTVIAKGLSQNPTPEERQRNLQTWRRLQSALREVSYSEDRDSA